MAVAQPDAFSALDRNHDGVLSRAEFYGAIGGAAVPAEPVAACSAAPFVQHAASTVTYAAPATAPVVTYAAPITSTALAPAPVQTQSTTIIQSQRASLPQMPATTLTAPPVYVTPSQTAVTPAASPVVTYGAPTMAATLPAQEPATVLQAPPVYVQAATQPVATIEAPVQQVTAVAPAQYTYAAPQTPTTTAVAPPVYVEPQPPVVSVEVREPVTTSVMPAQAPQPIPSQIMSYTAPPPQLRTSHVMAPQVIRTVASVSLTDRCRIFDDITQTIGQTPIVRINKLAPEGVNLFVKLEYFNPLSSVKDRLALAIIEAAEKRGELQPGGTVVEATSGNTGIALAMVCAQRGYSFVAVMAASFSVERRKVMRALGAKVLITPAPLGGTGMVKKAEELAEQNGWFLARQFETEANAAFHKKTTGPEILAAFQRRGLRLDYWVTGYGTGGTFAGAGEAIKAASPHTKVILSEPEGAALVSSGVPQERKEVMGKFGAPASGHPAWKPHPIQGWTPNFIPKVCEEGLNKNIKDDIILVNGKDAMETAMSLARFEGVFCGTSGGATVWTALEVCKIAPPGSNILAMVPDTAERYLSTPLFESIDAEMNAEEKMLFATTPLGID
mmetsp:Transcript_88186/g.222007  ORF Transcript_88186/g.222007 Transcript_88186/m.222007 type:complete len:615 (-) Transcript_88186:81-1925(-)